MTAEEPSLLERFDRLLAALDVELRTHYGDRLVSVAVFGSVGRETPRADSDVDVLLVVRDLPDGAPPRLEEFSPVETRLRPVLTSVNPDGMPTRLAPILRLPEEVQHGSPLFLDMVEDARILYDAGGFFATYLDGLRERLRNLGSRRIWRGETWYWDVKPDFKPGDVFEWP